MNAGCGRRRGGKGDMVVYTVQYVFCAVGSEYGVLCTASYRTVLFCSVQDAVWAKRTEIDHPSQGRGGDMVCEKRVRAANNGKPENPGLW
jgi:hypothetical protein